MDLNFPEPLWNSNHYELHEISECEELGLHWRTLKETMDRTLFVDLKPKIEKISVTVRKELLTDLRKFIDEVTTPENLITKLGNEKCEKSRLRNLSMVCSERNTIELATQRREDINCPSANCELLRTTAIDRICSCE